MDRRLFNAAWAGDVVSLRNLTQEDPRILHVFSLAGDNPLHIACMAGHLHFAKEMIKLKKNMVDEINEDGLSSLHIAATNGDLEIVKELLNIDGGGILCMVKNREGRIPLHCAVIKGRFEVIKEFVEVDPRSVVETTARGETVLHLAVKNNQFKTLQFLVGHLRGMGMQNLLKNQDDEGNTILHLAIFKKQYEVINLLLGKHENSEVMVDVNAKNVHGQTPLDVLLLIMHNEMGDNNNYEASYDKRMENILVEAGAQKGSNDQPPANIELLPTLDENDHSEEWYQRCFMFRKDMLSYFKFTKGRDSPGDVRNCLLVIVALITTVTYQAILSPPGGAWQENSSGGDGKSYIAGRPIMQTYSPVLCGFFLLFNSLGFSACVYTIWLLTAGFPMKHELNTALVAIVITYEISIAAFTPKGVAPTVFLVLSMLLSVGQVLFPFQMIGFALEQRASGSLTTKQFTREVLK